MSRSIRTRRPFRSASRRPSRPMIEVLEGRVVLTDLSGAAGSLPAAFGTNVEHSSAHPAGYAIPIVGYGVGTIRNAYGMNSSTWGNGAGQTIAIVDAYNDPNIVGDLAGFDSYMGVAAPPSFKVLNQSGGTTLPGTDPAGAGPTTSNWEMEEALDVEWSHAIAPGANLVLIECDSPSSLNTGVRTAAGLPGVSVVSMSFGTAGQDSGSDSVYTTPAGHEGVTFLAATGDHGSPGQYPAYSPNVVAVGGTTLNLNFLLGNFVTETAWSGSGGGTSRSESEPAYQDQFQETGKRTIPDVSFDADPNTGVAIYDSYNQGSSTPSTGAGGTSLATPCWAGLIAIANQGRVALGLQTLNTTDPTEALQAIYSLPNSDFRDITSGSNGAYSAGPGYDEVTGRGSPIVNAVITDLARYMSPPLVVAGSAAPVSATGATLNASVQMPAYFGSSYFQYSTNPTFTPTVQANLGSGFNFPGAVAVDGAGDVFVADTGNNAVKEILPGGTIKTIGSGFNTPEGVAVDRFGDVLVADTGNNAVKVVFPNGAISTIGSGFSDPIGVAVDRAGDVFVADYGHNAVKEIQVGGTIRTIGSGFSRPFGVALDAAGDVYVADTGNNAVKEVLPNGTIKTIGSGFNSPTGVAVDGSGDVFVADFRNNAVKEVLPGGTIQPIGSGFLGAAGVAVDGAGDVFVADYGHNQVVRLSPGQVGANPQNQDAGQGSVLIQGTLLGLNPGTTYYFRAVAAGGVGGGTTVGPSGSFTTLALPTVTTGTSSAVGATGATLNGTVNPNGTTASAWFQYSTDPSFTPTVARPSAPGSATRSAWRWTRPATSSSPNRNNTVKVVPPGGTIVTFLDRFNAPSGVAVDAAGDVFVADTGNNAVKEVLPRHHQHHRLRVQRPVRRGGGRPATSSSPTPATTPSRRSCPTAPSTPSAPGSTTRPAWRWTGRATSSSPTPATTPSRRCCPTAPSTSSAPGSSTLTAWRWTRPATSSSPIPVTTPSRRCCPTAPSTPSAPGSARCRAWRWTRPATSSSPTPASLPRRAVDPYGRRHALAADGHDGHGGVGHADRPEPGNHLLLPRRRHQRQRHCLRAAGIVHDPGPAHRHHRPGRLDLGDRGDAQRHGQPERHDHHRLVPVLHRSPRSRPPSHPHRLRVQPAPDGVAVDAVGDVFVADYYNSTVTGGPAQRHDQDHRLRVQQPERRGGGRGRRRLRRRLPQQRRQGGAAERHHQASHRLRVQTARPAWRWTRPATSSSPTTATTPSRRSCPTAPSTSSAPGSAPRPAWRWTRPATSSSPTRGNNAVKEVLPNGTIKHHRLRVQRPQGVAVDAAGDVFVADYCQSRRQGGPAQRHHHAPSAPGSASRPAWRWTRPATSSSPTGTTTVMELSPPTVGRHALAADRHDGHGGLGHARPA